VLGAATLVREVGKDAPDLTDLERGVLSRFDLFQEYELRPVSEPSTPSNVVPFPPNRVEAVAGVASVRQLLHHIVVLDTVERERLEQQLTQALILLGGA
jgi:hypothetical protein